MLLEGVSCANSVSSTGVTCEPEIEMVNRRRYGY